MAEQTRDRAAVILGATGLVGAACLELLVSDPEYERVTTLGRRPFESRSLKHDHHVVDFANPEPVAHCFAGADVFCCIGTTLKKVGSKDAFRRVDYGIPLTLAKLSMRVKARQWLLVSAVDANPDSRVFYNRVKGELELALRDLGLPSLQIFRPSLLLGERQEFRLGEKIASAPMRLLSPLMLAGARKYRPIHARDLALAMRVAAKAPPRGVRTYEFDAIVALAHAGR